MVWLVSSYRYYIVYKLFVFYQLTLNHRGAKCVKIFCGYVLIIWFYIIRSQNLPNIDIHVYVWIIYITCMLHSCVLQINAKYIYMFFCIYMTDSNTCYIIYNIATFMLIHYHIADVAQFWSIYNKHYLCSEEQLLKLLQTQNYQWGCNMLYI
jgi:hypothetical protein